MNRLGHHIGPTIPPPSNHGGDVVRLAGALGVEPKEILDLSATMNPLAPDIVPLVRRLADTTRHYPDPMAASAMLASAIGVAKDRVLVTNGGSEAIALVAAELSSAVVVDPEFSLWRRHLNAVLAPTSKDDGRRVRSNPNNPTGRLAADNEQAACWDEAFYPLSTGSWTRGDADRGALVVGSLTKVFSCPGLRLGYVVAPSSELIATLAHRQPMWSVNSLALAVLSELLEQARLKEWASELDELKAALGAELSTRGFSIEAGDAPWLLVHDAGWLRDALARRCVLVRDCSSFGLVDTVRIAAPGPAGLDQLRIALDHAIANHR